MTRAPLLALVAASLLASACTVLRPAPVPEPTPTPTSAPSPPSGEVELQVFSGFAPQTTGTALPAKRIVVLVDATRSMLRRDAHGGTLFDAARGGAADALRATADGDEVSVEALGNRRGAGCGVPERLTGPDRGAERARPLAALTKLAPEGEASVATSLQEIQTELDAEGATRRTTVVVFTDLEDTCGGDLCAAAESLVQAGGWVDLRVVGDAPTPACIAALRPSLALPGRAASYLSPPPPHFRVVADEAEGHSVLASGQAGSGAVTARAGLVALEVDLIPPERIGPFRLREGETVRIRLLDFPGTAPPERTWQVEREGEKFERRTPGGAETAVSSGSTP